MLYRTGIRYHVQHVIQNGHYVSCAARYTERALRIMRSTLYRTGITYHAQHMLYRMPCTKHAKFRAQKVT